MVKKTEQAGLILREKVDNIEKALEKAAPKIMRAIPSGMGVTPEQFNRAAFTAITGNPKLIECHPATIVRSVIESAELGLTLQNALGQAYIVPYGNKAQLQVGYRGYVTLFYRSGVVDMVYADYILDGEQFRHGVNANGPFVEHYPPLEREQGTRKNVIGAYALGKIKGASNPVVKVISRKDIEEAYAHNQAVKKGYSAPAWEDHWGAMAMKTAILRLRKVMPAESQRWVALADERDIDSRPFDPDAAPEKDAPESSELDEILANEEAQEAEVVE